MSKMKFKSIKDFLNWKNSEEGKAELATEDVKFFNYESEDLNPENGRFEAFVIHDVVSIEGDINGDGYADHHLTVIGKFESEKEAAVYSKKCLAPTGCVIDWDKLSCAYTL